MATMQKWKCHKVVEAAIIRAVIDNGVANTSQLLLDGQPAFHIDVDAGYLVKHRPHVGGYYIRYADGYESFSPAGVFEAGYTRWVPLVPVTGSEEQILQFFEYAHLPQHLQAVSRPFAEFAGAVIMQQPRSAERTVALRKLLECKDATVRAALPVRQPDVKP